MTGLRDQLADTLMKLWEAEVGEPLDGLEVVAETRDTYVDALLPVVAAHVERRARERAAEELVAAAMSWRHLSERSAPVVKFLRARAAALRGQP